MPELFCYAFAEDALSCKVMVKIVDYCNANSRTVPLRFYPGFPENKGGCNNLKKMIPRICNMAKADLCGFVLTDLDVAECAPELIRNWFNLNDQKPTIPDKFLFRIAEREVESWLMADKEGLAAYLSIAVDNFSDSPDSLSDPKQCLLNIIRLKGRKRYHRDMLPRNIANVGIEYNYRLSKFVNERWNVATAASNSESLRRAIAAINRF
ncbi:MAG: hypothetical protein WC340_04580 [Kiritimatiellia bacterium]